jgi:hypothetical protein
MDMWDPDVRMSKKMRERKGCTWSVCEKAMKSVTREIIEIHNGSGEVSGDGGKQLSVESM